MPGPVDKMSPRQRITGFVDEAIVTPTKAFFKYAKKATKNELPSQMANAYRKRSPRQKLKEILSETHEATEKRKAENFYKRKNKREWSGAIKNFDRQVAAGKIKTNKVDTNIDMKAVGHQALEGFRDGDFVKFVKAMTSLFQAADVQCEIDGVEDEREYQTAVENNNQADIDRLRSTNHEPVEIVKSALKEAADSMDDRPSFKNKDFKDASLAGRDRLARHPLSQGRALYFLEVLQRTVGDIPDSELTEGEKMAATNLKSPVVDLSQHLEGEGIQPQWRLQNWPKR